MMVACLRVTQLPHSKCSTGILRCDFCIHSLALGFCYRFCNSLTKTLFIHQLHNLIFSYVYCGVGHFFRNVQDDQKMFPMKMKNFFLKSTIYSKNIIITAGAGTDYHMLLGKHPSASAYFRTLFCACIPR